MVLKRSFDYGISLFLTMTLLVMIYLVSGLFRPFYSNSGLLEVFSSDTLTSILVSALSIIISISIVVVSGTLLAFKMHKKNGQAYEIFHGLIMLPLLLPPTVAGLVLLQGFGSNSWFSHFFFGGKLSVAFHFAGIVVTQVFITLPYFYQMMLNGFEQVEDAYEEEAQVAGADSFTILRAVLIPMTKKNMLAGIFLCGLRGLSEFGATIMFAGNMVGKTQTMTTRIYQLYQMDVEAAFSLAALQVILFILPFAFFIKKQKEGVKS